MIKKLLWILLPIIFILFPVKAFASDSNNYQVITSSTWTIDRPFIFRDDTDTYLTQTWVDNTLNNVLIPQAESQLNGTDRQYYIITPIIRQASLDKSTSGNYIYFYIYYYGSDLSSAYLKVMPYNSSGNTQFEYRFENSTYYEYYSYQYSNNPTHPTITSGSASAVSSNLRPYGSLTIYDWIFPSGFILKTNIPKATMDNISVKYYRYLTYKTFWVNGTSYGTPSNGTIIFKYSDNFIYPTGDTIAPILDFTGINNPYTIYQGSTFTAPMPIATDNIDGNITNRIVVTSTVNPNIVGDYDITYEVCDNANNCTTAVVPVYVISSLTTINLGEDVYAFVIWPNDFSTIPTDNKIDVDFILNGYYYVDNFDIAKLPNIKNSWFGLKDSWFTQDTIRLGNVISTLPFGLGEQSFTTPINHTFSLKNVGGVAHALIFRKEDICDFEFVTHDNIYNNSWISLDFINNNYNLQYALLDKDGNIIFSTKHGLNNNPIIDYIDTDSTHKTIDDGQAWMNGVSSPFENLSIALDHFTNSIGYVLNLFTSMFESMPTLVQMFIVVIFGFGVLTFIIRIIL
jgi:hypothetical protein